MLLQWLLFPFTIIFFNAATSLYSQGRLFAGVYRERFDVTAKSALPPEVQLRPANLES